MFELSGFESGPVAVALTGAVLGWVLRPLFLRYRPAFFLAIGAIAVLAALYGLSSEARAVADPTVASPAPPRLSPPPTQQVDMPVDARSLLSRARDIARSNGGSLAGEPARLVARALDLDPDDATVREMAANAAFDERDYAGAIREWRALAAMLPPQAAQQQDIDGAIARATLMSDATR